MTYDTNNIFAKILRNEVECTKVLENELVLAFMDVMPQAPGHTLVIPKFATENIFDLPEEFMHSLLSATKNIAKAIKEVYDPTGVMILQLNGPEAGQSVFHLHFHIIQRSKGLNYKFHSREIAPKDELETEAKKIIKLLKN